MDPKSLTVSIKSSLGQQLLQAGRTGAAISLGTLNMAFPKASVLEAVSPGLQDSIAALKTRLEAIDSKIEKNQMMVQEQLKKQQDLLAQMQLQL
jgi:flagellar capping protein FliD